MSPKSDETADAAKSGQLGRKRTRQLLEKKGTSTRQLVEMYLQETQEEQDLKEEEEKQNNVMDKSVQGKTMTGTTFSITPT